MPEQDAPQRPDFNIIPEMGHKPNCGCWQCGLIRQCKAHIEHLEAEMERLRAEKDEMRHMAREAHGLLDKTIKDLEGAPAVMATGTLYWFCYDCNEMTPIKAAAEEVGIAEAMAQEERDIQSGRVKIYGTEGPPPAEEPSEGERPNSHHGAQTVTADGEPVHPLEVLVMPPEESKEKNVVAKILEIAPPKVCSRCGKNVSYSSVPQKQRRERREQGRFLCGMCDRELREEE